MASSNDLLEFVLQLVTDGRKDDADKVVDFVAPEELAARWKDVAPVAAEGATPDAIKAMMAFVAEKRSVC